MNQRDYGSIQVMRSFMYEVNRATASLMYVLEGMEAVRNRELPKYRAWSPLQQRELVMSPRLSYIDMELGLSGAPFDPGDVLERQGEAEQLAFMGWVERVFNTLWDSQYRNDLKRSFYVPNIIPPELDALGDLRLIRNDLVHNHAIASSERTGKCIVLNWFKTGERMIFGMHHVFDFLNQMGMLSELPVVRADGAVAHWSVHTRLEADLPDRPGPRVVSLRLWPEHLENGSTYYVVSVVFSNGVFCNMPVYHGAEDTSVAELREFFNRTTIDDEGNVRFANGQVKNHQVLYGEAIDVLLGRGKRIEGKGIPGPWVKFRNP